jgi:hypothetical protein
MMSVLKSSLSVAGSALLACAFATAPIAAQGRGAGGGNPHTTPTTPAHGNPPAVPPGQAKPSTPGTTTPPAKVTTPKVPAPLVVKPSLAATLQPLLPAGTKVDAAAMGFKNLGQFVAAVHVSHNLDIPFETLKTEIVTNQHSLGEAIQTLKPQANVKTAVTDAENEAKTDINARGK